MKSTKFSFFLIFFLISFLGIKNVNANLSPHKYGWVHKFYEYPGKYLSSVGCTDPEWTGGAVFYNVVLEYSTVYTDLTQVQALGNKLNLFYNPKGIFLNIVYVPNICDCPNQNSSGLANGRFPNCVHGVVVDEVAGVPGGQVGYFFVEEDEGDHNLIHELGHALGPKHTFDGFREIPSTHESITRTGSADCECNCLTNGDRICDTQPDPYYVDHPDENNKMFDYQKLEIKNEDQLKDPCGVDYKQISNVYDLIYNVMSYHPRGVPWERLIMTAGQVSAIKFKNASKPWNNGGPSNGTTNAVLSNGMTVNTPTTISNNIIFNGDLIVNSILNINDCSLMFAGKKIVVNAGGILIVNNSKLIPFSQSACFSTSTTWSGIEVKHGSSSAYIEIKNNSKIYGFAPYGITNVGNSGNARININSGSLISSNFPDIDAIFSLNSKALVTIKDATVSGGITLRNTIYGSLTCINANQIGSIKLVNSTLKMSHGSDVGNILVDNTFANLYIDIKNSKLGTTKIQESIGKIWIQNNDILNLDIGDVGTYAITNNNFIYNNSPSNTPFNISNKAGTNINKNLFFKNSLQGTFSVAQITAGPPQNGGSSPGLAVECNTGLQMSLYNRIAPVQGDRFMAAGNKFSGFPHVNYNVNSKLTYHYLDKVNEEPESITGNNASLFEPIQNNDESTSKCDFDYPRPPDYPDHCSNGVQDANEIGIDCGGSCRPCKLDDTPVLVQTAHCGDGIQNNGETGLDCGGKHCPPCDACNDRIMNYGETGVDCGGPLCPPCNVTYCNNQQQDHGETDVDCGGPCPPCNVIPPSGGTCTDGILNNGETQIDCGGPNCAPCPHPDPVRPSCTDGIKNGTETGVDCGGICPPCVIKVYLNTCYDGIKNYGETAIDCGGPCPACKPWAGYGETGPISGNSGGSGGDGGSSSTWLQRQTSAAARAFITTLNNIYGSAIIPLGGDLDIRDEKRSISSMMDEGSTGHLVSMIKMYSASQPATVHHSLLQCYQR